MPDSTLAVRPEWSTFFHEDKRSRNDARNEFQRDRDRILYSSAFRRLAGKTQVFRAGGHDHIRTRLTHTLEVAQIARAIARQLGLNEDLAEAIALGHDLGHTPFGHVGEDVLKLISSGCDRLGGVLKPWHFEEGKSGFKHNLQSLRVACELEKAYPDHSGLNLSGFVLWGIVFHSKTRWKGSCSRVHYCRFTREECVKGVENREDRFALDFYDDLLEAVPGPKASLEAFVVNQADEIAQRHHDLEDGIHARIISRVEAVKTVKNLVAGAGMESRHQRSLDILEFPGDMSSITFTGELARVVVDVLVTKLVDESKKHMKALFDELPIKETEDYRQWLMNEPLENVAGRLKQTIAYAESFSDFEKEMSRSSYSRIMNSNLAQRMDGKGRFILRQLFKAYITNPQQLPDRTILYFVERIPRNPFRSLLEAKDLNFREKIGKIRQKLDEALGSENFREVHKALARGICDYLAGMTDDMAMEEHRKLYSAHEEMKALR